MGIVKSFTSTKGDNLLHTGVKDDLEKFYVFVLHLSGWKTFKSPSIKDFSRVSCYYQRILDASNM